jgi:UDP:flavonoid glycosyltransferase YjiC (YdhE family)
MTRILYGLSGEGSGHSSRSKQMARHLESLGHEVWLASYDRGYRNLKDEFNDVLESHESEGNMKIQAKLDELMQNKGQQLKEFHHRSKRKKWAGQIEEPVVDSEAT